MELRENGGTAMKSSACGFELLVPITSYTMSLAKTGKSSIMLVEAVAFGVVSNIRFNKICNPSQRQMASGQGSHWLIESPTMFIYV